MGKAGFIVSFLKKNVLANRSRRALILACIFISPFFVQCAFADGIDVGGGPATYVDVSAIDEMSCWLIHFQTGTYGGLLLVVTGVGALVSMALGGYKAALNCLIVALGSQLIQPVSELMFDYQLSCKDYIAPTAPSKSNEPAL